MDANRPTPEVETTIEAQLPSVSLPRYMSIRERWEVNTRENLRRQGYEVDGLDTVELGKLAGKSADDRGPLVLTEGMFMDYVASRLADRPLSADEMAMAGIEMVENAPRFSEIVDLSRRLPGTGQQLSIERTANIIDQTTEDKS